MNEAQTLKLCRVYPSATITALRTGPCVWSLSGCSVLHTAYTFCFGSFSHNLPWCSLKAAKGPEAFFIIPFSLLSRLPRLSTYAFFFGIFFFEMVKAFSVSIRFFCFTFTFFLWVMGYKRLFVSVEMWHVSSLRTVSLLYGGQVRDDVVYAAEYGILTAAFFTWCCSNTPRIMFSGHTP